MAELYTLKQIKSSIYDFDVDGGVTGTIPMGIVVPEFAIVTKAYVKTIADLTSAGAALINITISGSFVIVPQAYTNFNITTNIVDSGLTPRCFGATGIVDIAITGANLTGGRLIFFVEYTQFPY
jgi:hypothetical protein